jgi:hypothetical protein
MVEGLGVHAPADNASPEFVAAHWAQISDHSGERGFDSASEALFTIFGSAQT